MACVVGLGIMAGMSQQDAHAAGGMLFLTCTFQTPKGPMVKDIVVDFDTSMAGTNAATINEWTIEFRSVTPEGVVGKYTINRVTGNATIANERSKVVLEGNCERVTGKKF